MARALPSRTSTSSMPCPATRANSALVFVTTASEQFGTNLRATAATTAPNIVRWSAAWTGGLWLYLSGSIEAWTAAAIVAAIVMPIAILATFGLRESYGTDLDFTEK